MIGSGLVTTLTLLFTTALVVSSGSSINPTCDGGDLDLGSQCSNAWDRLWDIRWQVCSNPKAFGFFNNKAERVTVFIQNPDCKNRGILFGSDSQGQLKHCYAATEAIFNTCLQNNCEKNSDCYASGKVKIKGELYQPVRYLRPEGKVVDLARQVTKLLKRDENGNHDVKVVEIPYRRKPN